MVKYTIAGKTITIPKMYRGSKVIPDVYKVRSIRTGKNKGKKRITIGLYYTNKSGRRSLWKNRELIVN